MLVLGRIAFQKGQDLLVPAWEARSPTAWSSTSSDRARRPSLAAAAPSTWDRSIRFMGGTDDVRPWLWAVDALLLSSRYETVALVVAEAMACRLPVVATDVDGPSEVLLEGDEPPAGTVVPLGRPDLLVEAVDRLRREPELASAQARPGVERAQTRFAPGLVAGRLEAAYRAAIADRGGTPDDHAHRSWWSAPRAAARRVWSRACARTRGSSSRTRRSRTTSRCTGPEPRSPRRATTTRSTGWR